MPERIMIICIIRLAINSIPELDNRILYFSVGLMQLAEIVIGFPFSDTIHMINDYTIKMFE